MHERTVGYILLGAGILVMAVSLYLVYLLFSNNIKPFQVFRSDPVQAVEQEPLSLQDMMTDPQSLTQMQSQLLTQIIDKQMSKTTNIFATVFFVYLLMLFGFRLSSLGVQLMRPIQVKLREASVPPKPPRE